MFEMVLIILGVIVFFGGITAWVRASSKLRAGDYNDEESAIGGRWVARGITVVGLLLAGITLAVSTIVTNGIGEAKVFINLDGTVAGTQITPGLSTKAPWQSYQDFDLFSQEVLYAGQKDNQPVYSGGTVSGAEVTVSVGGVSGGSTQGNVDISVTYSIDAEAVDEIYAKYRNQERFTKQIIEKTILAVIRQVPSNYTAVEFRGPEKQEASDRMLDLLNEKLNKLGVTVDFVNIQDVRYPAEVEQALKEVEVANQKILSAEADQRTAQVNADTAVLVAEGQAKAAIAAAAGQAEANRLLNESLSAAVLQQHYIDALGEGTIYVVPDGSTPFIGAK